MNKSLEIFLVNWASDINSGIAQYDEFTLVDKGDGCYIQGTIKTIEVVDNTSHWSEYILWIQTSDTVVTIPFSEFESFDEKEQYIFKISNNRSLLLS